MTDSEFWRDFAACKGETAELFYPEREDHQKIREAKAICRTCPVSTDCLRVALENGEPDGIWGGYTPDERELIRIANKFPLRKPAPLFPHGTDAGYRRHFRAGTTPCASCVRAHSVKRTANRIKQREADQNGIR